MTDLAALVAARITSTPSIGCRRPSRCERPLGIGSAYPPKTSLPQSRNISATIGIYTTGEQYFGALQEAIRKRWRDKHPALDHEPVERSPRRRRDGTLRTIPRAMGIDAIDDRIGGDSIGEDKN